MSIFSDVSSLLSASSFTIIDQKLGKQVAANISVKRLSAKFSSSLMKHSMEDGSTSVDARIIQPLEIELQIICPGANDLKQVNDILLNLETLYTITSKGLVFSNLMANSEQITISPEMLSSNPVSIKFKEIIVSLSQTGKTEQAGDTSSISKGISMLRQKVQDVNSLLSNVKSNVLNKIGL